MTTPSWDEESESPVSTLAILLQREGFRTDVLSRNLHATAEGEVLLRYWKDDDPRTEDGHPPVVLQLMWDLGVTEDPCQQTPTPRLGLVRPEDGPGAACALLAEIHASLTYEET